jgi:hypothetical protein
MPIEPLVPLDFYNASLFWGTTPIWCKCHKLYFQPSCYAQPGLPLKNLRSAHTLYLCVVHGSENKQQLVPYMALIDRLLGAFAELLKATNSFVTSLQMQQQLGSHWTKFHII